MKRGRIWLPLSVNVHLAPWLQDEKELVAWAWVRLLMFMKEHSPRKGEIPCSSAKFLCRKLSFEDLWAVERMIEVASIGDEGGPAIKFADGKLTILHWNQWNAPASDRSARYRESSSSTLFESVGDCPDVAENVEHELENVPLSTVEAISHAKGLKGYIEIAKAISDDESTSPIVSEPEVKKPHQIRYESVFGVLTAVAEKMGWPAPTKQDIGIGIKNGYIPLLVEELGFEKTLQLFDHFRGKLRGIPGWKFIYEKRHELHVSEHQGLGSMSERAYNAAWGEQ